MASNIPKVEMDAAEKKLAYDRAWRAKHRQQCNEANRKYRERIRPPDLPRRYSVKIGDRYGRLLVLGRVKEEGKATRGLRLFLCDCGKQHVARGSHVHAGLIVSCGCFQSDHAGEHRLTHGHTAGGASAEYRTWQSIIRRCEKPTNIVYHRYGAVGISVCERWHNFPNFLQDMGLRPSSKHSIDRIDNDGNYEPGNCRWATVAEQNRNRSITVRVALMGEVISLSEACERYHVKYRNAYMLLRAGRSAEHIFFRGGSNGR